MSKTVTVTGANGYVANQLVFDLLRAGYKVVGTVRNSNDPKHEFLRTTLPELSHNLKVLSLPDLSVDNGFEEAINGSDYVIHVANPLPFDVTNDPEKEMYIPSVNGVNFVVKAAVKYGVKRVILVSSVVTLYGDQRKKNPNYTFSDQDWLDLESNENTPYPKGKTLAEKRFWELSKEHRDIEFVSILPALVFGPVNDTKNLSSSVFISDIARGTFFRDDYFAKGFFPTSFGFIDNRDVSESILKSLVNQEVVGHRILLVNRKESGFDEIAKIIKEQYPEYSQNIPEKEKVNYLENSHDNSRLVRLLGREPRSINDSVKDTVTSFQNFKFL